jgi:hypothetical protein
MSITAIEGGKTIPAEHSATIASITGSSDIEDTTGWKPRAVHINTAGTITGFLKNDDVSGSARSFTVVAGREYPYAFRRITGVSGVTGLVLA